MKSEDNISDPLLHSFRFPLEKVFYPYGFPLLIRTNDERVLAAADESFGWFRQEAGGAPVRIEIAIVGDETGPFPQVPVIRSQRHLLWFVSDAAHHATCDFQSGEAVAWLSPRVFSNFASFRFHFLEALGYSLVVERHLAGIHAACLSRNNRGVLLWGDTGAGKSTLAYALAKRGWTYTADDGSFLVRAASDNLIAGNPERIRFRPSAIEIFPELDGLLALEHPNGKMTIEVKTSALHLPVRASRTAVHHVVFLDRKREGDGTIRPFPKEEALARLASTPCYGTAMVRDEKTVAMKRVLGGGIFELTYSTLEQAIQCLENITDCN